MVWCDPSRPTNPHTSDWRCFAAGPNAVIGQTPDFFRFGKQFNETYLGTTTVRGILCNHWRAEMKLGPSNSTAPPAILDWCACLRGRAGPLLLHRLTLLLPSLPPQRLFCLWLCAAQVFQPPRLVAAPGRAEPSACAAVALWNRAVGCAGKACPPMDLDKGGHRAACGRNGSYTHYYDYVAFSINLHSSSGIESDLFKVWQRHESERGVGLAHARRPEASRCCGAAALHKQPLRGCSIPTAAFPLPCPKPARA